MEQNRIAGKDKRGSKAQLFARLSWEATEIGALFIAQVNPTTARLFLRIAKPAVKDTWQDLRGSQGWKQYHIAHQAERVREPGGYPIAMLGTIAKLHRQRPWVALAQLT